MNADVLILQEVDINARRTHRLNIGEEIARKLQMNYAFGREFEELTQGSKASPAYHGQATLSRWSISSPRVIRFRRQSNFWRPHCFLPRVGLFQERLGGRIALVAEINVGGSKLVTYNLHLESRANDQLRVSQMEEVLSDSACYGPQCRLVVAGDLNLDVSKHGAAMTWARAGFRDALVCDVNPHHTTASGLRTGATDRLGVRARPDSDKPRASTQTSSRIGSLSTLVQLDSARCASSLNRERGSMRKPGLLLRL
jgi:endonuclease/exonuclease/phosphatase family metal-dependent hydrolase